MRYCNMQITSELFLTQRSRKYKAQSVNIKTEATERTIVYESHCIRCVVTYILAASTPLQHCLFHSSFFFLVSFAAFLFCLTSSFLVLNILHHFRYFSSISYILVMDIFGKGAERAKNNNKSI